MTDYDAEEKHVVDQASTASKEDKTPISPTAANQGKKRDCKLPDWVTTNLKNPRSLKVWFRCTLISWSCLILILPHDSLKVCGQAAFFGMLISFMVPAYMPVWLYVFATTIILLGGLLGWAWGCAAIAAAHRARDFGRLATREQGVMMSASGGANIEAVLEAAVFHGKFLDARSSAVFGAFLLFGVYVMGHVQTKYPKLKMGTIFFIIVTDISCSYGPLIPFGYYTLGQVVIIPSACCIAIALAAEFLIFPETLNTAWTLNLIKVIGLSRKTIGLHEMTMEKMLHKEHHVVEAQMDPQIRGLHKGIIALATAMGAQRGFLELEVTYSRLSGKDLSQLYLHFRTMIVRIFTLNAFFHLLERDAKSERGETRGPVSLRETHAILKYEQRISEVESEHHVTLADLLPTLIGVTSGPLKAVDNCLETVGRWLDESVQRKRSYNHKEWIQRMEKSREDLEIAREAFLNVDRLKLVEPYKNLFKNEIHLSFQSQTLFRRVSRPLFICLVFCSNLDSLCEETICAYTSIIDLAKKRNRNKIWLPTGIRKIGKLIKSKKSLTNSSEVHTFDVHNEDLHGEENDDDEDEVGKKNARRSQPCDPDALPPSNSFYSFAKIIASIYHFLASEGSIFGIRFAIVSLAMWIPAVIPNSAYFTYYNRGLWALISSQTGMALSGGEVLWSLISRGGGTILGLVFAMLFWYMSCGLAARGNPYGLAAVMAFGFIIPIFLRVFAPIKYTAATTFFGVTISLCIGYGWIDGNLEVLVNSGVGYHVAWKRALLVIIGLTATFIITLLPSPPSTRKKVRKGLATSTDMIHRMYSLVVERWMIFEASNDKRKEVPRQDKLRSTTRSRFIANQGMLGGLGADINMAGLDFTNTGPWQKDKYLALLSIHGRLLEAISQMSTALDGLDIQWRRKMIHTTAILDPNTISDISLTLTLLGSALRNGSPLPHASFMLLEHTTLNQSRTRGVERLIEEKGQENDLFSLATLIDRQFMKHVSDVMALITFSRQMDRFQAIVYDLVGEIDLPGFDQLKKHYDERLIQAYVPGSHQA